MTRNALAQRVTDVLQSYKMMPCTKPTTISGVAATVLANDILAAVLDPDSVPGEAVEAIAKVFRPYCVYPYTTIFAREAIRNAFVAMLHKHDDSAPST